MPDVFGETLPQNPHVKFYDNAFRGYYSVDLTASRMRTHFRAVSDRNDKNATVKTLKSFTVESGRPGLVL